jgi:hypothetical protein
MLQMGISVNSSAQQTENIYWDSELIPKIVIKDDNVIRQLLIDLFIIEAEVNYIEIYDVDKNGPAVGDLLKTYPSEMVYPIRMLSAEVQEIMNKWPYSENIAKRGKTINIRNAEDATPDEKILYVLAYAIKTIYRHDKPIKLYFEQKEDGVYTYELLGYNPEELKQKSIPIGNTQQQQIMDLLKAFYKELAEGPPTVIHVVKKEKITVKVPEDE